MKKAARKIKQSFFGLEIIDGKSGVVV